MTTRSHPVDRELMLILIALLLLAFATQFVGARGENAATTFATPDASTESAAITLDAVANPYWAPAHAFSRRPAPVYSDVSVTETLTPQK